jgi:hypothetical protein
MTMEPLFAALAEAVFSSLLQESGLAERTRAALGLDPTRRAFQTALAQTYAAFAPPAPGVDSRTIRAWDLASGESRVLFWSDAAIFSLALSGDGQLLACGDVSGRVWIFDVVG